VPKGRRFASPVQTWSGKAETANAQGALHIRQLDEPAWKSRARDRLDARLFPSPKFEPEPYPVADSLKQRLARQKAMFRWVVNQHPEFQVTIQFNDELDEHQLCRRLGTFDALLDHYWLRKRWAGFSSAERTFFIAFVEQDPTRTRVHVHLLLRRPRASKREPMPEWKEAKFLSSWFTNLGRAKGVCLRGDILFESFRSELDVLRGAAYVVKDFDKEWNSRAGIILSAEFHSTARTVGMDRNAASNGFPAGAATTPRGNPRRAATTPASGVERSSPRKH